MRSDNRLKKIWVELVGESAEFHNINIAVNSICVITFGLLFIMMVSDILLGLYAVSLVLASLIIINAILYYFARYKKQYNAVILIYTIVSYLALGLSFLFNFGINGPTVLGFFLTFLLLVAIVSRKYHLYIALIHTAFLVALYFAEYILPQWFTDGYSSDLTRIADWSVAYMICLAFTYFIVMFLRDNYRRERILAQQRAIDISEQNEKLRSLNMLTWSKSQMKGVRVNTQEFNVNQLLQNNLPIYHSIAEAKDISIDSSACSDVFVSADEEMTKAIFRNLLSNAIKFTPSYGKIKLAIEKNGQLCYIHVSDNGIGMSPDKQGELFTLNSKATYGTHNETGVGLGLVLCKEFAELQKGNIIVKSTENEGSTFTVGLPVS